ncbi:hypothetical protein [uncultured Aquimonas sp.]|uniref:hypothetical protein n=1 Tax=uncultured Aquimonas sp. TaxID=385483 RepID=UPI0026155075|nr:hypothetical protein [uncultured Aquimonas sp.]
MMVSRNHNDGSRIALQALRFFASEGDLQVVIAERAASKSIPAFFEGIDGACGMENYLLGVACIFVTYRGALLDESLGEEGIDALEDFSHRLLVLMGENRVNAWGRSEVVEGRIWCSLRRDAVRAYEQLRTECVVDDCCLEFKIDELIDPDEFRTTPVAKKFLSEN